MYHCFFSDQEPTNESISCHSPAGNNFPAITVINVNMRQPWNSAYTFKTWRKSFRLSAQYV